MTIIHPTAIVNPTARIGSGVIIGPYSVIYDNVTIEDNTKIGSFCSIGSNPQSDCSCNGSVYIGKSCNINNYVTIDKGTVKTTIVSSKCSIYNYSYVAHDCTLRSGVHLGNNVHLGGFTEIGYCTQVKSGTLIAEDIRIGQYCFIGAGSAINKDIIPYMLVAGGYDARPIAYYKHESLPKEDYKHLRRIYHILKNNLLESKLREELANYPHASAKAIILRYGKPIARPRG